MTSGLTSGCMQYRTETTYKCFLCNTLVCNKSETCSIFAPETTEGWKAGSRVTYCVECNKTRPSSTGSDHKESSNASNVDLDHEKRTSFSQSKKTAAKPATFTKTKGQRCLNLSQRVELIAFHKKKPSFGVHKLAERFGSGRSQVSEILKSKDMILKEWEINESCS